MYSDASKQFTIDENTPNNQQDVRNFDQDGKENGEQSKSNEELQVEMSKQVEEEKEDKFTEAGFVGEGLGRSSGLSNFNDADCGEPVTGQHLRISFAFTEEDSVELENKCRSFWKFIKSHPQLERIKVLPMNNIQSTSADEFDRLKKKVSVEAHTTAMQWVQQDDKIKSAMRTKFKSTYCDLNREDYCEARQKQRRDAGNARADGHKGHGHTLSGSSRLPSADEVSAICKSMDEWDATHPRCMDPPGHKKMINTTI